MSTSAEGIAEAGPHPNCALCRPNWWAKRGARSRYLSGPVGVAASARTNYLQVHHPVGCPAPPTASAAAYVMRCGDDPRDKEMRDAVIEILTTRRP